MWSRLRRSSPAQPGPWARPTPRGVPTGRIDHVRHRRQPRLRGAAGHVSIAICNRIDKITVNEAADTTFYDSPATELPVGFGRPIDHPGLPAMTAQGTAVFGEAVSWSPTRSASNSTRSGARRSTPRPPRIWFWGRGPSRQGASPGSRRVGRVGRRQGDRGAEPPVEEGSHSRSRLADRPGRLGDQGRGRPTVIAKLGFLPPPDFEAETMADFMVIRARHDGRPPSTPSRR